MNYPVVYLGIKRIKRGYYQMTAETMITEPSELGEIGIVELVTKRLEEDIREMPETWLWTHKRWKHKKPVTT